MSRPPSACITPRRAGGGGVPGEGRAGLSAAAACSRKRRGTVTAERDPLRRCIGGGVRRRLYRYWSAEVHGPHRLGAQIPRTSPTSAAISVRRWAFGFALTRKLAPCRAGMAGAEASGRRPLAVASYRAPIDVLALARPSGGSRLVLSAAPVTTGSAAFERISSSCFVAAASSC